MEIEKKFLLRRIPENLEQYEKRVIEQGYLCTNPVVRIRRSNDEYILTYKSHAGVDDLQEGVEPGGAARGEVGMYGQVHSEVRVNQEVEAPLNQTAYEHLRQKIDGNPVRKRRYLIPLEDGNTGELDVFEGVLSGLTLIEVEFPDVESAGRFVPPDWFGQNVSDDYRYSNSFLSTCKDLTAFR